jgi:hypothetical protein
MKLPQLSLRELFLLVVIAAMGCGWWVDRQHLISQSEIADRQAHEAKITNEELTPRCDDLVKSINAQGFEAYIDVHTGDAYVEKRTND